MYNQVMSSCFVFAYFLFKIRFQQSHMFEYLECLVDSLRVMAGDRIKVPEKCRFDPEESCMSVNI